MIKEAYVSFETAKLLKEKGFNEPCICYSYDEDMNNFFSQPRVIDKGNKDASYILRPTKAMTMKWLREVHNIHIVVHPYTDKEGHHFSFLFYSYAYGCWQELGVYITDSWSTYEEACEAAIKYCLKHLIN